MTTAEKSSHTAEIAGWVDEIMEQAQVFASAYSMIDGRFDFGSASEDAEEAKAELRAMLKTALSMASRP